MDAQEYTQKLLAIQKCYATDDNDLLMVLAIGLPEEVGEILGIIKKSIRDGTTINRTNLKKEFADTLGYLVLLGYQYEISLEDMFECCIHKLEDRKLRGTLRGSGNDR